MLATTGATLLGGCLGLAPPSGTDRDALSARFLSEPTDWAHPDYDAVSTGAPPGRDRLTFLPRARL